MLTKPNPQIDETLQGKPLITTFFFKKTCIITIANSWFKMGRYDVEAWKNKKGVRSFEQVLAVSTRQQWSSLVRVVLQKIFFFFLILAIQGALNQKIRISTSKKKVSEP